MQSADPASRRLRQRVAVQTRCKGTLLSVQAGGCPLQRYLSAVVKGPSLQVWCFEIYDVRYCARRFPELLLKIFQLLHLSRAIVIVQLINKCFETP